MARLPIQVEAIIFRRLNGKYEYLLLKRIELRGGFWQPVTGGLEEGEDIKDAVMRELREETGITNIKRLISGVHEFKLESKTGQKELVFGAEVDPKLKITFDKNIYPEHDEHRWCSYDKAMKLLKWRGNKEGLKKLHLILKKQK
jgi:8-oxo-dGTP pyrophosphatase MutT (NUDIX family)